MNADAPEKTKDPFHMDWNYERKDLGDWANRRFPGLSPWFETKIAPDAKAPDRAMVMPEGITQIDATLKLPDGYTLIAPDNVKLSTPFAEYTSTYVVKGQTIEMDRLLRYKLHELPVSDFNAYRDFLKAVSDDASQMLQMVAVESTPSAAATKPTVASSNNVTGAGNKPSTTTAALFAGNARPSMPEVQNRAAADLIVQARNKLQGGDIEAANDLLLKAKQVNESEPGLWDAFGDVDWLRGNTADGIDAFSKEVELHPDSGTAYQRLARAYLQQGDWTSGEQVERAWCKAEPSSVPALILLASSLLSLERPKESAEVYEKAVTLSQKPEELRIPLGRAQLKAGQIDAGKATLHAVMDTSQDAMTLNNAAYELADADTDLVAAEAASRRAVRMMEASAAKMTVESASDEDLRTVNQIAEVWDTLGWIVFREHRLAQAEDYTRCAWSLDIHAEEGLHLGQIYEAEGKKQEAAATYRQAADALYAQNPWPLYAHMKETMLTRAALLSSELHEAGTGDTGEMGERPGDLLTYTIASPLHGQHGRAEFLLLLQDNKAKAALFLRGDEALKPTTTAIEAVKYRAPIPSGSEAKILRRASLSCTIGGETCQLRLVKPSEARMAK